MRIVQWILALSALLFVSGIAFIVAGAREARAAAPAADVVAMTPVASVKQIMNSIVTPTSTAVYEAVGSSATVNGIEETAPQNDEEWTTLAANAAALAESGNLMIMDGRAVDSGDWVTMSRELTAAATLAVKAAEAKSTDGILEAGSAINETCDKCHGKYQRQ